MEPMVKDFYDYLIYIGILNNDSLSSYTNIYNQKNNNNNNENNLINNDIKFNYLTDALSEFLNNLSKENSIEIATNIINRYRENKKKITYSTLKNLIIKNELKYKLKYLNKWIQFLNNNNLENNNNNNFVQTFGKPQNLNNNNNYENIIKKSLEESETNINNNYNNLNQNYLNTDINNHQINYPNSGYQITKTSNNNINRNKNKDNLLSRQKKFLEKAEINKKNQIVELDKITNVLCPFTPTIYTQNYKNKSNMKKDAYTRLYDDVQQRKINSIRKQKEEINKIKQKSNFKATEINPNIYADESYESSIDKLYNEYKIRKSKKNLLQKEIDQERGLTFKPNLNNYINTIE
jgi:hypothetical protein